MVAKSDALWVCVRGPGGHPHGLQAWRVREPVLCIRVALARWHNRVTRNKEMLLTSPPEGANWEVGGEDREWGESGAQNLGCSGKKAECAVVCTFLRPPPSLQWCSEILVMGVKGLRLTRQCGGKSSGFLARAAPGPPLTPTWLLGDPLESRGLIGDKCYPGQSSPQARNTVIRDSTAHPTLFLIKLFFFFLVQVGHFGFPDFIGKTPRKKSS